MDVANTSKLTPREIDRAETDLLLNISAITQRQLSKLTGYHESKISRTDWRFIASILCALKVSWEFGVIGRVMQEVLIEVQKGKPQNAGTFGA